MTITTLSSREFGEDTSRAKKAATMGPVFITDRGEPAHVLLTIEEYRRLTGEAMSLRQALEQQDGGFEFNPLRLKGPLSRPVNVPRSHWYREGTSIDIQDFAGMGVAIVNPWDATAPTQKR